MPTPPDFTAGTALAAASLNKIGLWEITAVTAGTNVTQLQVNNCFSSTYDNYRVTWSSGQPTATDSFRFMLGTGATNGHYASLQYDAFYGTVAGYLRVNNGPSIYAVLNEAGNKSAQFSCDVMSPNLAQPTVVIGQGYGRGFYCDFGGTVGAATQYTGFTITIDGAGTFTGGTATVYGYGKV